MSDVPEWVDDPTQPLNDYERAHYIEKIKPSADAGNAMAVLAVRAFSTVDAVHGLLAEYVGILQQGAWLALDVQRSAFVDGAEWAAGKNPGFVDVGIAQEEWRRRFEELPQASELPSESESSPAEVSARALMMAVAYSRAVVALTIILDRHALATDEREAVEEAMGGRPQALHEAVIARKAIDYFVDEIGLNDWDNAPVGMKARTIGRVVARVRSEVDEALAVAWAKHDAAQNDDPAEGGGELTYWNGEPALARKVTVVVAAPEGGVGAWYDSVVGWRRDAVEIVYGGETFYIDDDELVRSLEDLERLKAAEEEAGRDLGSDVRVLPAGLGWVKVTSGRGSPTVSHRSLLVEAGSVLPR